MTSPPIPVRSARVDPRSALHADRSRPDAPPSPLRFRLFLILVALAGPLSRPAVPQTNAPVADLQLVTCTEERPGAVPGPLLLRLLVKNAGAAQSQDAALHVRLLDAAGAFVASAVARLDNGAVDPGAEQAFLVTIADAPACRRVIPALVWTTAFVSMSGNDFTTAAQLEVGQCRFRRSSNGDLLVTGKVRNGLAAVAGEVTLGFAFRNEAGAEVKSVSRRLKGVVPAGATASFLWRIPECPPIASFTASVSGVEAPALDAPHDAELNAREEGLAATAVRERAGAAVAVPPADPAAGKKEEEKRDEGKPAAAPAGAPEPPPAPYTLFVDGVEWVRGTFRAAGGTKTLKYTGDTAFLKIRFTDAKGEPAQPEAAVVIKVSDKGQPRGFCKRTIAKTAWKLDAGKITQENVTPDIVAFHPKEGTVWVGLVTAEDANAVDLALDVSVEIKKAGTWTWKGLRDPFRTELAPPEPEKKK